MFIVSTRVKLKPGRSQEVAALFRESNPDLVKGQPDWLGAKMIFDPETDVITVLATWRDAAAYQEFSGSEQFQSAMGAFRQHFSGPPEISLNQVLVEMEA